MNIVCGEYPATSKEHRGAAEFLHVLSQEANLILLGMLADASDECLLLTRFFDNEAFRLEEMAEQSSSIQSEICSGFSLKRVAWALATPAWPSST